MTTQPPPVGGAVLEPLPAEHERGVPSVNAPRAVTRWTRALLAAGLLIGVPVAGVAWYFHATAPALERTESQKALPLTPSVPAKTFTLPAPVTPPAPPVAPPPPTPVVNAATSPPTPTPLAPAPSTPLTPPPPARPTNPPPPPKPLPVLDKSDGAMMVEGGAAAPLPSTAVRADGTPAAQETDLGRLLNATATPPRWASVLADRDYLLTKGTFIECVLETRLDSTVPGMTSCRVTRPIYSDTGRVVLVDRGSTVVGEYQATLHQGMARIFVLWTRLKTPSGVVVSLDSPATDALGGGGIPGEVDTHFWQRFGGALLLSLVNDVTTTATLLATRGSNSQVVNLSNTSDAAGNAVAEALRNTINIPPTLYTNQGARVGIYVARDLSFKGVYELQASGQNDDYQ